MAKEAWLEEAKAVARVIAAKGPVAQRLAKESVNRAYESTLETGLDYERKALYLAFASEDAREGPDRLHGEAQAGVSAARSPFSPGHGDLVALARTASRRGHRARRFERHARLARTLLRPRRLRRRVVAQLADGLAEDPSLRGFLVFAGLFVPVWWAWVGYTFYADRFDTDDPPHRVLMIGGMFAVAVLASVIPGAFQGETASFAIAYAGVRAVVVVLNARAWWHLPAARPLLNVYIPPSRRAVALFLVSAAVEPPYRYWLWAVALAIDLGTPLASQERIRKVPIHGSHIPERVGLFTIIVFGESVLAVVVGRRP